MQQRWVLIALALALAGVSWAIVMWPAQQTEQPAAPTSEPEPAPLPPSAAAAPAPNEPAPEPASPGPPAAEPPQPSAAPAQAPSEVVAMFEHDLGPVAEYKERFASEPRDSAASDAELQVRDAFKLSDTPNPVFRSVLCRKTLCKLEIRMNAQQLGAYVAAMSRLTQHFDKQLAVTRTADNGGEVSLEVYAQRLAAAQ